MRVYEDIGIMDFEPWYDAIDTQKKIIEYGAWQEFDFLIEELYPEGISKTELNDLLRFESEWIYEHIGIHDEDEEE